MTATARGSRGGGWTVADRIYWRPDPETIEHVVAWLQTRAENVRIAAPGPNGEHVGAILASAADAIAAGSPWMPSCDGAPAEHPFAQSTDDPLPAFRARYCDPAPGVEDPDPLCVAVADELAALRASGGSDA